MQLVVRDLNAEDVEFYITMARMKHLSRCLDKQVICLIVDIDNNVLSIGVNTIEVCDENCHDKAHRVCVAKHAEAMAIENLSAINTQRAYRAYINNFPCEDCQAQLSALVHEIVAFGSAHKKIEASNIVLFDDLAKVLLKYNGEMNQLFVINGELAELITATGNVFARDDRDNSEEKEAWLLTEQIDVELQLAILDLIAHNKFNTLFVDMKKARGAKYAKLFEKFVGSIESKAI